MKSADRGSYAPVNLRREPRVPADPAAVAAHLLPLRRERERSRRSAARDGAVHPHPILGVVDTAGVGAIEMEAPMAADAEVEEIGRRGPACAVRAPDAVADVHPGDVVRIARD